MKIWRALDYASHVRSTASSKIFDG
jgi:hypothetical protein